MYFKTVYNILKHKVGRVNNRTLGRVRRTSITSLNMSAEAFKYAINSARVSSESKKSKTQYDRSP